jgi:hypothetical protein
VFAAIVLEASAIAAIGAVSGYMIYAGIVYGAAVVIRAQTGVVIEALRYDPVLIVAPAAMIVVGAVAGCVPALKAYATDVASNLSPTS